MESMSRQEGSEMTREQAAILVSGCGDEPMSGDYRSVKERATALCEAAARAQGYGDGPWEPTWADEDYIHAQLVLADAWPDQDAE